jgi:hypothetical protein
MFVEKYEKTQKIRPTRKNMYGVPTPIFVAKKMGKMLGRCKIL